MILQAGESTGYAFDLAERLNTITLANGSVVSLRYDEADRLVYLRDNSSSPSSLGFSYGLEGNGNRVTITENDGSRVVNVYDANNPAEARTGTAADRHPRAVWDCDLPGEGHNRTREDAGRGGRGFEGEGSL